MVGSVRPKAKVGDTDRFDETLWVPDFHGVIKIQSTSGSKAHVFGPSGRIPHASSQTVPHQLAVHGNQRRLCNISGHPSLAERRGFVGEQGHL